MKICRDCKEKKRHSEFYTNGSKGYKPNCKQCESSKYAKGRQFKISKLDTMINNYISGSNFWSTL